MSFKCIHCGKKLKTMGDFEDFCDFICVRDYYCNELKNKDNITDTLEELIDTVYHDAYQNGYYDG